MTFFIEKEFKETFIDQKNLFDQLMSINGEIFRALENRKTMRFVREKKTYFIKQHNGVGWKEIIKNLIQLRLPVLGAKNEWQAIQRLNKLNIPTMRLVAYGERGCNPARKQSFIVTEELRGVASLEDICKEWATNPPDFQYKFALNKTIAHIARILHGHGMNHRDFYLCHFLQDLKHGNENPTLHLIDLHRTQIRSKTPLRWIIKDISGLYFSAMDIGLTKRDILRFLKNYFQMPLKQILSKKKFLAKVEKRAFDLYFKTFKRSPSLPFYFYLPDRKDEIKENIEWVSDKNYFYQLHYAHHSSFMINTQDGYFVGESILRIVPNKRVVVKGFWHDNLVVAKIFFGKKAEKHLERDMQGYEYLTKINAPIPGVYYQGKTNIDGVFLILFEYLEPKCDINSIWKGNDLKSLIALCKTAQQLIANLHQNNLYYPDLHPTNFLLTKEKLYLLDFADIVVDEKFQSLSIKKSIENITLFYSQLYLKYHDFIFSLFSDYCQLRKWENTDTLNASMLFTLNKKRYQRIIATKEHCSRNCTGINVISSFNKFIACNRQDYQGEIKKFISNPDYFISKGEIVKKGNTCTAAKIILNGKAYLVKRYNIKSFWHLLKICLKKSRSLISWQNAHVLDVLGIKTANPIAIVEHRFGILHGETYFLSEYVEGELLRDYMVNNNHSMADKSATAKKVVQLLKLLSLVNIAHRDTKFTNYIIRDGQPIILDLDAMTHYQSRKQFLKAFEKDKQRLLLNWEDNKAIYDLFFIFTVETRFIASH